MITDTMSKFPFLRSQENRLMVMGLPLVRPLYLSPFLAAGLGVSGY